MELMRVSLTITPKNKLYLALRELGCVIRTLFLLEYASNAPLRAQIQAATTKIEAYFFCSQSIFFGGDSRIKSRDPVEYEKRIKYKDLIANSIMLHNLGIVFFVGSIVAVDVGVPADFVGDASGTVLVGGICVGSYVGTSSDSGAVGEPNPSIFLRQLGNHVQLCADDRGRDG